MCGLVGMAGDFFSKHRMVMKDMLFFNTLRGKDSTGVSYYNQVKNEVVTRKLTVPGYEFVAMPWIDDVLGLSSGAWIGHGRAKTVGDVTRLNAHPFEVLDDEGNIGLIGAHNGTLHNKWDIEQELKKLGADDRFGTDSEALLNLIYRLGPEEAIKKARGAWALSWWDSADNSINLLRNKERPLCYALTEDHKLLIWASEPWMIRIACDRQDLKLAKNEAGVTAIFWLTEDTLFKFKIPSFKHNAGEEAKCFQPVERKGGLLGKPEEKKFPYWPGQGGYRAEDHKYKGEDETGWWNGVNWDEELDDDVPFTVKKDEKKGQKKSDAGSKAEEGKPGPDQLVGYEGEIVDRAVVAELIKSGCDWCGGPIKDPGFGWLDELNLVCKQCMNGSHITVNVQEKKILNRVLEIVKEK
jgi:predicted glutamine amidotransferase